MGKFIGKTGCTFHVVENSEPRRYIKIVLRDGVPIGVVVLGGAEDATILGRLRPWIRNRRKLADVDGFLQGRFLVSREVA
jgi:NAD(P)H-nitrite reductase large subunit